MTKPVFAFFNNLVGDGKTSLVYHLAWMFQDLGRQVVAVDLDPQANLTAAFLNEDRLEQLWPDNGHIDTIYSAMQTLLKGIGEVHTPHLEPITDSLGLVVGDLLLSTVEEELSAHWSGCLDRKERAFKVISAFSRMIQQAVMVQQADLALIDLGPNLGSLNHVALLAADYLIVPLSPDLFSLQGLLTLGPTLRRWRAEWQECLASNPASDMVLPSGKMEPFGFIILQSPVRLDKFVMSSDRIMKRIPEVYYQEVVQKDLCLSGKEDPTSLGLIRYYHSLAPMAQEARKPIFHLKPADGAIGSHALAVKEAYTDYKALAESILKRANI